jgi:hypothetical protein
LAAFYAEPMAAVTIAIACHGSEACGASGLALDLRPESGFYLKNGGMQSALAEETK